MGRLVTLGRQLIRRANRLGMIVDMSHAHDDALAQAIELSALQSSCRILAQLSCTSTRAMCPMIC